MVNFFDSPILNSPYEYPMNHWELDESGQPTHKIINERRKVSFITPIPKPRNRSSLEFDESTKTIDAEGQKYNLAEILGGVRYEVDRWRALSDPIEWGVTSETARLLHHWRTYRSNSFRPFFCQIEAVEIVIWLTEVAPSIGRSGKGFVNHLKRVNLDANPGLMRMALKLATGAGKTAVMAMLIAWQTVNAVRHPSSRRFTCGFLVVTPGITIKDRLRVLHPNDPDSYYRNRDLVPKDLIQDLDHAKIVVTNFHAFKLRESFPVTKGGRALLQGRGSAMNSTESIGEMLRRVMPVLMGFKHIMVLNDEAHHCYREKPGQTDEGILKGDDRKDAKKNQEAARVWISGLEAVQSKIGLTRIIDLSATPFFLRGSGYMEGTLFPWTVCDYSLMDAIECGIVKLPRVPVADNIAGTDMPKFRNLWEHIGKEMPMKGRSKSVVLDPLLLPVTLQTALEALYGHYEKTYKLWQEANIDVPPCFIVVCNNTATSKMVFDYIAGFEQVNENDEKTFVNGRFPLLRNYDSAGIPLSRPHTLLIDSEQLESDQVLDANFRRLAADEIDRFRREIIERTGDQRRAEVLSDQDILREVMNTVGKKGRLGGRTRCVVSVSMLTEGWDANTVTHVLGIRAFSTQLLCEQVVGRALRRQSYELNDEGLLDVEYADVLGIPFDFTANPVAATPKRPKATTAVYAIRPERDECEIRFPRIAGYRVELPSERLAANFSEDSTLELTPELVGPSITHNEGIIGEGIDLNLVHTRDVRNLTVVYHLTKRLLETKWRDVGGQPKLYLFGQLKKITRRWIEDHLFCKGNTYPAQLLYQELADMACERITKGIVARHRKDRPVNAMLDPFNPSGTTADVRFVTSKTNIWKTDSRRCHLNFAVCDSNWESEFCRIADSHPLVRSYVKNQNLGFEIPYKQGARTRAYIPDFIVIIDTGHAEQPSLNLIVEIKGLRGEDAKDKKLTMDQFWIPSANNLRNWGYWAFIEIRSLSSMDEDFNTKVREEVDRMMQEYRFRRDTETVEWLATAGEAEPDIGYDSRRQSKPLERS